MNNLQIFNSEEFGEIRTVTIDGEPWFVGKDVAESLGYSNTRDAISKHIGDEDKNTVAICDGKGNPNQTVINESGLYALIFGSKLESAKRFKHWVTSEVLPSIRSNGGYIANQENLTPEQIVANALIVAQNIITQKDKQIEEMKPKADYFDELVDRNLLTNFRDTAKELGVKESFFINWLLEKNYIYRDCKGKLQPYAASMDKGLFEIKEFSSRYSNHAGTQTLVTPKGRETFRLLLGKENRKGGVA